MTELYRPLYLNQAPFLVTSRRTAELTKYAANAFLATKITFINEIADLCEQVGANVQDVARGIGLDNRIGSKFLHAGPGYGGSCFPKDTLALIKTAQDYSAPVRIVETVAAVNDQRKRAMGRKVVAACGGSVRGRTIAVLGLTFKPNTDDMRDAPSIAVIAALQDGGAKVRAYDPEGMGQARAVLSDVEYAQDPYECARGAGALVIVTEWDIFRALDLNRLKAALAEPVVVDLRNIYRPEEMTRRGFTYVSVGRATAGPAVMARSRVRGRIQQPRAGSRTSRHHRGMGARRRSLPVGGGVPAPERALRRGRAAGGRHLRAGRSKARRDLDVHPWRVLAGARPLVFQPSRTGRQCTRTRRSRFRATTFAQKFASPTSSDRCGRLAACSPSRVPLVVSGHSAGGHLAACLLATDWRKRRPARRPRAGRLRDLGLVRSRTARPDIAQQAL